MVVRNMARKLKKPSQAGFTLVEIMIVMSISALLGVSILGYQGSIKRNAQFLDAVERVRNSLVDFQNQSTAATGTDPSLGGQSGATNKQTFLGKRIHFTTGSSDYNIDTLFINNSGAFGANYILSSPVDQTTVTLPYGVVFDNSGIAGPPPGGDEVVFIQNQTNTRREIYTFYNVFGDGHSSGNPDLTYNNYNSVTSSYRVPLVYRFWDATHDHYCDITVDPHSGAVTRGPMI